MKERILSAIVMAAIVICMFYFGGVPFLIGMSLIATLVYKEFIDVRKDLKIPTIMKMIGLVCMLLLVLDNRDHFSSLFGLSYETLSIVFLCLLTPTVFLKKKNYTVKEAFYLASVTLFVGTIFNLFITLYSESLYQLLYIVIIACVTDIFALFGGLLIGKHPLTEISPKKTIEGSLVGTLVGTIVAVTFHIMFIGTGNIVTLIIITIILSVIGQIGDIFFSLVKRENNVKDFSNLIPGHGGVLDRIDSMVFILIAYFFIIQFI